MTKTSVRLNQILGLVLLLVLLAGCGGSGNSGLTEGKGNPGDTDYSKNVIQPYFVDNGLVDPPVNPDTMLPSSQSNESELGQLPIANQESVGSCTAVSFAQAVYAADTVSGATMPLLDNVQYSYLFARFYESQTGGQPKFKDDSGSYIYSNFRALTNQDYFATYTNGHLPLDGPHADFPHATGVFYPPWQGPSIKDDPNGYWNDMKIWNNHDNGPTMLTLVIRTSGFTAASLDLKARLGAGNLILFGMDTNDTKEQFDNNLRNSGVMKLPFTKPAKGDLGGHTMLLVGYDDSGYGKYNGAGAFKVRNSWGSEWGDHGSWYLPYALVDGTAESGADGDWPLFRNENFVYISAISHN